MYCNQESMIDLGYFPSPKVRVRATGSGSARLTFAGIVRWRYNIRVLIYCKYPTCICGGSMTSTKYTGHGYTDGLCPRGGGGGGGVSNVCVMDVSTLALSCLHTHVLH